MSRQLMPYTLLQCYDSSGIMLAFAAKHNAHLYLQNPPRSHNGYPQQEGKPRGVGMGQNVTW